MPSGFSKNGSSRNGATPGQAGTRSKIVDFSLGKFIAAVIWGITRV
jgi:hypothetical protein